MNVMLQPHRTPRTAIGPGSGTAPRPSKRRGFTLIEILVVIALTLVLLVLVFAPLIQAFQFTGSAQSTAAAQDAARNTTELMTRELTSAAGVLDTSGQYLNLRIRAKNGDQVVARAYNAYIDIVPPRPRPGQFIDPTVDPNNPTVNLTGATQTLPELTLPLAPGTNVIRYYIGPRYPVGTTNQNTPEPYVNRYEGLTVPGGGASSTLPTSSVAKDAVNNPYVLYRASYQPYTTGGTPNTTLFALTAPPASGGQPILNDPDFFRIVTVGETNPTTGQPYSATAGPQYTGAMPPDPNDDPDLVSAHNTRVLAWKQIAKFVIADQNIDLLGIKRTVGGNLVYSAITSVPVATYAGNTATVNLTNEQLPTDSTTTGSVYLGGSMTATPNTVIPTIRTTVNFGPATVVNDPLAPTNSADVSQGSGALGAATTGLPYIPASYKAAYGWWQGNPTFSVNRANQTGMNPTLVNAPFTTVVPGTGPTTAALVTPNFYGAATAAATDLVLYGANGTPAYDITKSTPFLNTAGTAPAADFIALTFDSRRGVANFAIPALPNPQYYGSTGTTNSMYTNPYWTQTGTGGPPPTATTPIVISSANNDTLDLHTLANSVTFNATGIVQSPLATTVTPNARVVFNSERVMGPDMSDGIMGGASATLPAAATWVPYTRVASNKNGDIGPNQYYIDYDAGTIQFSSSAPPTNPTAGTPVATTPAYNVEVAFSYQNNMDTTTPTYTAATVQASYLTAAAIQLNFGIRAYDSATSVSSYFGLNSQVAVGNAKA